MGLILDIIDKDLRERGIGKVLHTGKKVIETSAQAKYHDMLKTEKGYCQSVHQAKTGIIPLSRIEIYKHLYTSNHETAPRGRGSWAFSIGNKDGYDNPDKVFWTDSMTFQQACKVARLECQKQGVTIAYVLP